ELGLSELEVAARESVKEAQALFADARTLMRLMEDVRSWLRPRDVLTWAFGAVLLLGPALFTWLGTDAPHVGGLVGAVEGFGAITFVLRQARTHVRSVHQLADR